MWVHARRRAVTVHDFAHFVALVMTFQFFLSAFRSLLKHIFPSFDLQKDNIYYEYYELLKCVVLFKVVSVFIPNVSGQWCFWRPIALFLFIHQTNDPNLKIQRHTVIFKPLTLLCSLAGGGERQVGWKGDTFTLFATVLEIDVEK